MPEELQDLLDRIQKDGIEKAETEAAEIVANARREAETIAGDAESRAADIIANAEKEAATFEERARVSLTQAARDVVLSVGEAIQSCFREMAKTEVEAAMTDDALQTMVVKAVESYLAEGTGDLQVLLSKKDAGALKKHFTAKFAERINAGLDVKADDGLVSGFRVSTADRRIQHDFSADAIADAVCQLVRPNLAQIVRSAMTSATD